MMQATPAPRKSGKFILGCFLAFFGVVCAVDAGFVYTALHTNSGEVTEQAYEKGLAYNKTLEQARTQPVLKEKFSFQDGIARWSAIDNNGAVLERAAVKVKFIRPVKDGYDFETVLQYGGSGLYEAKPDFPVKGLWMAQLSAEWNGKRYQTTQEFIVK